MPTEDSWSRPHRDDLFDKESETDEPADESDEDAELSETVPCPECGAEIYEDAFQCPVCGSYLPGQSSSPWAGRPLWWILLGLLGTGALIYALAAPG